MYEEDALERMEAQGIGAAQRVADQYAGRAGLNQANCYSPYVQTAQTQSLRPQGWARLEAMRVITAALSQGVDLDDLESAIKAMRQHTTVAA